VAATHPVFTPEAKENLNHPAIREIVVTNSIPVSAADWPKVKTVSLAPILATAVRRSTAEESIANLFQGASHGGE
jgi:ribose-phosphate pyrophosphokinase